MTLICLLITHYVSDFIFQSRETAKKKSTEVLHLGKHVGIIFITFFISILNLNICSVYNAFMFSFLNVIFHAIIDGTIWNLYKWHWTRKFIEKVKDDPGTTVEAQLAHFKFWEDKLFFDTLGFDQLLHVSILVILYEVFIK